MKTTARLLLSLSALSLNNTAIYADATNNENVPFFIKEATTSSYKDRDSVLQKNQSTTPIPFTTQTQTRNDTSSPVNHRIQVGGDYSHVSLKPNGHQSFNGNLWGAQAIYEYCPINFFYAAGKVAWKEGTAHAHTGKRSLVYIDVQERLGYTCAFDAERTLVSFFSGFGYRHVGQKFEPKQGDNLHFQYNEFYFPVGWVSNFKFNSWFSLGLDFTWMPQIFSTVGIVPLKGARWDLKCSLANFSVELPINFSLCRNQRFSFILKPFYEYWKDGHSTAKASNGSSLGIPSNTYDFWGVDLNLAYRF